MSSPSPESPQPPLGEPATSTYSSPPEPPPAPTIAPSPTIVSPASPAATAPSKTTERPTSPGPWVTPGRETPRATFIGLIIGSVLGSLLLLRILAACVCLYRRRMQRGMRPPQPHQPNEFGGSPQHRQEAIPPTDGKAIPKPTLRLPTLEFERPNLGVTPYPAIALGLSGSTFTYEELAFATSEFSDSNLLGEGGFGYVHKGVLPDGRTVAIKQLKSGSLQGEREFLAEVQVISRIHHRHLVSLVGYCVDGAQRMMLVYEFVPNNTLEFHLHGKYRATMDWATRMKIAIGSAKGLAYLHEDCQPRIIHRDIKASNILLDDHFEAKVADFGLAKFSSDTNSYISTRIMGTIGYLAPEYAASGKLTDKSDVFSFGVVLLELITGRRPGSKTESFTDDSMVEWARPLLSQALENGNSDVLADPRLQKNYNPHEMIRMISCAAKCVSRSARSRPRMSQVVQALVGNISMDDLNEGNTYRRSSSESRQNNEDRKKFWKQAPEGQGYSPSEYSGPSSEYDQHFSASSSSGQQNSRET